MPSANQPTSETYKPALSYDWLTPFYDATIKYLLRESTFKQALISQASLPGKNTILDIGCGTGTLTILAKQNSPVSEVIGIDGDPQILAIARAKAAELELSITLDEGMSYALPYEDNTFDCVLSSLMLHHLTRKDKKRTFGEIYRVLKPDGELHVADWGKPHNVLMRLAFYPVQLLDGFETTADNVRGDIPYLMKDAQFAAVEQTIRFATAMGTIALYRATKML